MYIQTKTIKAMESKVIIKYILIDLDFKVENPCFFCAKSYKSIDGKSYCSNTDWMGVFKKMPLPNEYNRINVYNCPYSNENPKVFKFNGLERIV